MGHVCMHLAKSCPQLRVVLQDLPAVIEKAKTFWDETAPKVVQEGRARLEPINFLKESPVVDCDYYFVSCLSSTDTRLLTGVPFTAEECHVRGDLLKKSCHILTPF